VLISGEAGIGKVPAAFALVKAMPARAVIRLNSGDTSLLEMDNAQQFSAAALER
jgi:hypothetical protein